MRTVFLLLALLALATVGSVDAKQCDACVQPETCVLPPATCINASAPPTCVLPPATCTVAPAPPTCVLPPATCIMPPLGEFEYKRSNLPVATTSVPATPQLKLDGTLGITLTAISHVARVGVQPYPVAVILSGTAGNDVRNRDQGYKFNAAGISTVQADMYGPRGIFTGGSIPQRLTTQEITADAFTWLHWAVNIAKGPDGKPLYDRNRAIVVGYSMGGTACMNSASLDYASIYAERYNISFTGHGCVYPLTHRFNNASWPGYNFMATTGAPIQIHIGDHDNYDSPVRINMSDPTASAEPAITRFMSSLPPSVYSTVQIKMYPNSSHAFDRQTPPPTPAFDKDACMGGGCIAPLVHNPVTREQSENDMVAFAKKVFKMP
jgi:dienelactone hydrolase